MPDCTRSLLPNHWRATCVFRRARTATPHVHAEQAPPSQRGWLNSLAWAEGDVQGSAPTVQPSPVFMERPLSPNYGPDLCIDGDHLFIVVDLLSILVDHYLVAADLFNVVMGLLDLPERALYAAPKFWGARRCRYLLSCL